MVSVALCTYNGEKYITQQLDSIVNQTSNVDEIVICDDQSTDRTILLVEEYRKHHPEINIKVITNDTNIGVRNNFEQALNLCNGDIKFLSDQDDIWYPNKVETILNFFSLNKKKSVVFSNADLIDSDNKPCSKYTLFECLGLDDYGLSLCNNGYLFNIFVTGGRAWGATMAIRKNVICKFDYPTQMYHDYILALEAVQHDSLGYIKTPLMQYRIHNDQKVGLGKAIYDPPKINIYDLEHGNVQGYPCSPMLQNEIDMRDLRYSFFSLGIRGIPKIILNYPKYKTQYKSEWKCYLKADINRIITQYKKTHHKKNIQCSPS